MDEIKKDQKWCCLPETEAETDTVEAGAMIEETTKDTEKKALENDTEEVASDIEK